MTISPRVSKNLTWAAQPGADNRVIAGQWWQAQDFGKPLVSLSTEIQDSLHVNVGDSLTFDIAGESFDVKVASIRKVKWDSFQPNFFVVFAPGVLEKTAGTYITSANLKPGDAPFSLPARQALPERVDLRHRRSARPGALRPR